MAKSYTASSVMDELFGSSKTDFTIPLLGELVEGTVISFSKNRILVDLNGIATGIITGQESNDTAGTIKTLSVGDTVSAFVIEDENDDGLIVLSLRKASQKKTWNKFIEAYENDVILELAPTEANKGGLLLNIDGIKGFIPVSQLAPLHYPRVNGANSNQIFARLQKLVGEKLKVKILNLDREGGKLILSEKAAESNKRGDALDKLEIGQKIKGQISGIVNFGIFVTFQGLEGLVHISEIAWGHVKDPNDFGKLGTDVEVLVIGKDDDKISLSMKRLYPDPWVEAAKVYQVGTIIESEINRLTPFGAFVKLDNDINGLIHVSEISDDENSKPEDLLTVGKKIKAKIITIDPEEHRVGLSIKALTSDSDDKKEKKSSAKKEKKVNEVAEDKVADVVADTEVKEETKEESKK